MPFRLGIGNDENVQFADRFLYFRQLLHHVEHIGMQSPEALLNPM